MGYRYILYTLIMQFNLLSKLSQEIVQENHDRRAFTLIEMIVAITVFLVVITAAVSVLLSLSFANRQSQQTRAVVDAVSIVFDDIIRTARTAESFV